MGTNLIPVFHPDIPDATPESDIHLALTELDSLDELARRAGLERLSTFVNDFEDLDGEIEESDVSWHPVHDGIATLRGLGAVIDGEDSGFEREDKEILLQELSDLEQCLKIGAERKAQFCLIVG